MSGAVRHPVWPERLLSLARSLKDPGAAESRAGFWLILNLALTQRLRLHARRLGSVDRETIHDLASQKALDLVGKIDRGQWNPQTSSPGELVSFVSTVARNALVDELRRSGRMVAEVPGDAGDLREPDRAPEAPGHAVERNEFIAGLLDCLGRLQARHRTIWLFRVLNDMPSRSIAQHPEVLLKVGHVDVIVQRCRDRVRRCMRDKGHDDRHVPPGTMVELWMNFRFHSATPASNETGGAPHGEKHAGIDARS